MSISENKLLIANNNHLSRIREKSNSKEIIELENESSKFFIKKTWFDVERGKKAIRKQVDFDEIRINDLIIKSPKVFETHNINNEKFIARMEYVEGHSGSDITSIGSRYISLKIKDALSMLINLNFERSKIQPIKTLIFEKKLNHILSNLGNRKEIEFIIKDLINLFNARRVINLPIGPCHGDLTLSNIIISSSGSLNLIDFLDTFISTPLWDLVKIYQDIKYGWSYRSLAGPEKESARIFFANCIPNQIRIYEEIMSDQILLFDALNLARLSPYIKNDETEKWLIANLKKSMFKLMS